MLPPYCTHHKNPSLPLFTKFSPFSSPLPILGPRRDGQLLAVYILCINGCPRGVFCHEPNSRGPQWVSPGNRSGACALSAPTNQSLCTLPCLRVLHSVLRHSSFKATKPNQTKPNQTKPANQFLCTLPCFTCGAAQQFQSSLYDHSVCTDPIHD